MIYLEPPNGAIHFDKNSMRSHYVWYFNGFSVYLFSPSYHIEQCHKPKRMHFVGARCVLSQLLSYALRIYRNGILILHTSWMFWSNEWLGIRKAAGCITLQFKYLCSHEETSGRHLWKSCLYVLSIWNNMCLKVKLGYHSSGHYCKTISLLKILLALCDTTKW